jgi:hypothetical protein
MAELSGVPHGWRFAVYGTPGLAFCLSKLAGPFQYNSSQVLQ